MSRIALIGSTRFTRAFGEWNARLTLQGNLVYSVALVSTGKALNDREKIILDYVHMKKIEASEEVFVLDVSGYVGESTRREIILAEALGRKVRYLSREYPEWSEDSCLFTAALTPVAA